MSKIGIRQHRCRGELFFQVIESCLALSSPAENGSLSGEGVQRFSNLGKPSNKPPGKPHELPYCLHSLWNGKLFHRSDLSWIGPHSILHDDVAQIFSDQDQQKKAPVVSAVRVKLVNTVRVPPQQGVLTSVLGKEKGNTSSWSPLERRK